MADGLNGVGAFYPSTRWDNNFVLEPGTTSGAVKIDASYSDNIYSGTTLQPAATQTLMIIKV